MAVLVNGLRLLTHSRGLYCGGDMRAAIELNADLEPVINFGHDHVYRVAAHVPTDSTSSLHVSLPRSVSREQSLSIPVLVASPMSSVGGSVTWDDGSSEAAEYGPARLKLAPATDRQWQVPLAFRTPRNAGTTRLRVQVAADGSRSEASQQVEVVDQVPDTRSTLGHKASIGSCRQSVDVIAGGILGLQCDVYKAGDSVWLPPTIGHGGFALAVREWRQADGRLAVGPDAAPLTARGYAPWPIWPGQQVTLTVEAHAPPTAGRYVARVDVVGENVAWFEDLGASSPLELEVNVNP